jgi:hypothetical protein
MYLSNLERKDSEEISSTSTFSSSIISRLKKTPLILSKELISDMLIGNAPVDDKKIQTYNDYDSIFKIRHDLIHSVICDKLNYHFGERTVESMIEDSKCKIIDYKYYSEIKNLTPDYMNITVDRVSIMELTVSVDPGAKRRKAAKYALLTHFFRRNKYTIDYKIIVINPQNVMINRSELIEFHKLDDGVLDFITNVCTNASNLLYDVHLSEIGSSWYQHRHDRGELNIETGITIDDVIETYKESEEKVVHSLDDLQQLFSTEDNFQLSKDDSDFIDSMVDLVEDIQPSICKKEQFIRDDFVKSLKEKSRDKHLRSVLPIPLIEVEVVDSALRDTKLDVYKLVSISAKMKAAENPVINKIGSYFGDHLERLTEVTNNNTLFHVKFSQEEKSLIALEGPGRKKYIRMGSIDHLREEEKYNGYCLSPEVNVDDIEKISFMLSKKSDISPSGDLELDSNGLMNAKGVGLDYVRLTQSIYREININAMRYDRRKLFCIKPVGATGIYIILFPGPKLRCGELANTCWFKLLIDNEVLNDNFGLYNHWAFKRLERDSCVSFSKWLSVDVHRLDHYIRAYDKILMSYASILAVRYRSEVDLKKTNNLDSEEYTPGINLVDQFNRDNTNTLGLIILIYLEDRRSTSKMLQNVRYLVMTGLSMFPRFRSTMDKFAESIRSPLQLYLLNKCLDFIPKILFWRKSPLAKFGNVRYDSINHIFIDSLGGSNIRLPRPMISGGSEFVEFSEILSEMYFTMLFNKNQDDPTHASFQIL